MEPKGAMGTAEFMGTWTEVQASLGTMEVWLASEVGQSGGELSQPLTCGSDTPSEGLAAELHTHWGYERILPPPSDGPEAAIQKDIRAEAKLQIHSPKITAQGWFEHQGHATRLLPSYTLHMRVAVKVGHTHKPASRWPRSGEPNGVSAERQGAARAQPLRASGHRHHRAPVGPSLHAQGEKLRLPADGRKQDLSDTTTHCPPIFREVLRHFF